jgi:predicted RNA polymerase sigma factor
VVRAKRTLRAERVEFEVPAGEELRARLHSVLEVVYLIFNEGYAASAGEDWLRPELCREALRLGRILAALAPDEPEAHGLLALMELQASRTAARVGPDREPIRLPEQDRARWDRLQVARGLAALARAERRLAQVGAVAGPYVLQAAIAACHGRARTARDTDWRRIAILYGLLAEQTGSPVIELNRAVAVAMSSGPEAGLELVDRLAREPSLERYHHLPSVRGDLLERLGRLDEARVEFEHAAELTENDRERQALRRRAAACAVADGSAQP